MDWKFRQLEDFFGNFLLSNITVELRFSWWGEWHWGLLQKKEKLTSETERGREEETQNGKDDKEREREEGEFVRCMWMEDMGFKRNFEYSHHSQVCDCVSK